MKKLLLSLFLGSLMSMTLAAEIPQQQFNQSLYDQLPDSVKKAGVIRNVLDGSFPPYYSVTPDKKITGAMADFAQALSEVLGVKIEHTVIPTLSANLMGIQAGRYDISIGPVGDYPNREVKNDFVDYVQEYVIFAVQKGNPQKINGLEDVCGKKISVTAGGSAEAVIKKASEECVKAKKPAVNVLTFDSQTTSALAVRSGRADAFFSSQAPLSYFVSLNKDKMELAAVGKHNGFGEIYQGAVLAKDSPLTSVIVAAFQQLFDNGTYQAIMDKYNLHYNVIDKPGKNLATDKR